MYRDVHEYYRSCDSCQKTKRLATQSLAKLVTILQEEPLNGDLILWGQLNQ